MDEIARFAIYAVPDGAFYRTGADWLGWDSVAGAETQHPVLDGLPGSAAVLTETPRKYGFHATLKAPFRLAHDTTRTDLERAVAAFASARPPIEIAALEIRPIAGFVAAVPAVPTPALSDLAGALVTALDAFRGPLSEAELARRRKAPLTERQDEMLRRWGYPYVFDEFRYHMTLSGRLSADAAEALSRRLHEHFASVMPVPYVLRDLALLGEARDGRFHVLNRYALAG